MNYSPRSSAVQEAPSAFNNEEEFAGPGALLHRPSFDGRASKARLRCANCMTDCSTSIGIFLQVKGTDKAFRFNGAILLIKE